MDAHSEVAHELEREFPFNIKQKFKLNNDESN